MIEPTAEARNASFDYLSQRSRLGLAYRRWWLYPRLSRLLSGRAIDFGCDIGDFLASRRGTVGVDVNARCVAYCRDRGLEAYELESGRAPFEDASFDGGILDNVLEHLDNPAVALDELHRLLRDGGILVIGVPTEKGYAADPDHKIYYDRQRLVRTAANFSFELLRVFRMPLPIAMLDRHLPQQCFYGQFTRR